MSVGKLATILSLDASGWTKGLDGAAADVDKFGASVRKKFKGMQDGIAEQKLATTPFNIRKQAGLDLAAAATGQKYTQALAAEKVKQLGGGSVSGLMKGLGTGGPEFAGLLKQAGGGSMLGGVGKALSGSGGLGGAVGTVATLLGSLATPVTAALAAVAAVVVGFKVLGDSMAGFVGLYSPATAARWQAAWDDLYAVIGAKLVPALELMTSAVRKTADSFQGSSKTEIGLHALGGLGGLLALVVGKSISGQGAGSSVGMAVKQAGVMTDAGELGKQNLIAAFSAAGNTPQDKANELLGSIAAATGEMLAEMRRQAAGQSGQTALQGP